MHGRHSSGMPAKPVRASIRHDDSGAPLTTRALDYEGRIADLRAKIHELEESRRTLTTLLRDLETKEGRIEHIHRSWMAVFDAIVDPIFMHDRQGRIVRANRAYAELAGMDIKDVIGRLYWQVFPRREGPLANCSLTLSEKREMVEEDLALETGKIYRCRFFTLRDRAGGYFASLHIMQDITERKSMETALQQERDFISAVMHTLGALVVVLDREGRIIQFNHACETVTGFSFAEIEGKPLWDALLLPEELDSVRAVFNDLRRGMFPNEHENYWRTKDGGRRLIHWSNTALTDESGAVQYVLATGIDITDRRAAEETLRESENRYHTLFETMLNGFALHEIILDEQGKPRDYRFLEVNPAFEQITGLKREQVIGKTVLEVLPETERYWIETFGQVAHTGKPARFENYARDLDKHFDMLASSPRQGQFAVIFTDITAQKKAQESLRISNRALRALSTINQTIIQATAEEELLAAVCQTAVSTGGYRFAWIGFAEQDEKKTVRPVAQAGFEEGYLQTLNLTWADEERGRGPTGTVIRTGKPCIIRNIHDDPAFAPWRADAVRQGYASCISLPLSNSQGMLGAISIYSDEPDAFDADEVKLLTELVDDLSYGIATLRTRAERDQIAHEHEHHLETLKKSLVDSIQAIATTLEMRDPYTAGHQRRVAKLAESIGREMGLPEQQIEGIHFGGLIHDIGKIQVPAEILSYPGKLGKIQFDLIKTHPQAGYDILKGINFPWPVAEMVRQHHERLDGSGYPQGLKNGAIILEARIMAVADTVEAMASHRPYRPGLGIDKALDEIIRNRGTHYDPPAVDACVRLFREKGFTFES